MDLRFARIFLLCFTTPHISVSRMEPFPACLLLQRAACFNHLPPISCVLRINNTTVTIPSKDGDSDCREESIKINDANECIKTLSDLSSYVGITRYYDPDYQCVSPSCVSAKTGPEAMHLIGFPFTSGGLCVMFLSGMVSGVFISFFAVFLYIKWKKSQPTKEDNTYVDLDMSEIENEEQPTVEYTQRGSVAFVREIASVYYKDVDIEKDRTSSTRSKAFSFSLNKSSRKSSQERKSSLNRNNSPNLPKQMFAYEQTVPEENPDCIDLDSPVEATPLPESTKQLTKRNITDNKAAVDVESLKANVNVEDKDLKLDHKNITNQDKSN